MLLYTFHVFTNRICIIFLLTAFVRLLRLLSAIRILANWILSLLGILWVFINAYFKQF
jgi:hypothetical protein